MSLKPGLLHLIATLDHPPSEADEAIFRRTACDVIVHLVQALIVETGATPARVLKVLKHQAIEADRPVKVELLLDAVARLEADAQ